MNKKQSDALSQHLPEDNCIKHHSR